MEFLILGPLEVRSGTGKVGLGGEKRRALLAMLLVHANEPVSPERLAVGLWGEDAAADALKTVRVHVSRTRTALGDPSVLETTPAGYRLRVRAGELDADRFEDLLVRGRRALADGAFEEASELLRAALELWRGGVLADLRYEPFAQPVIARLEELRWDAIEARNDADLALGRPGAVLARMERPAEDTPLRERLVEQRMRALYAAGRHVEALAAYRDAQRRLDAELGLQPGLALRELERAILGHDASLQPHAPDGPPPPPTPTVGRARQIEALVRALGNRRLVTLTGPGGVGKTRIAVEAARALAPRLPGGVHVAYLARTSNAGDVPGALVGAVRVAVQPGERDEDALVRRFGGSDTLLVADNVEHVLGASPLLGELVAACPRLRVLATSREPLRLKGEQCIPVAPLAEPDAVALFVDRARDRRPEFGLTDDNAPAVAELCRRLDGLPLAIELAAGRIGLLDPEQMVERLADLLPLLEGGARDAPTRQRTIRATLSWSLELLDPAEQRAFRALGVFVGGGELDAAQVVTGTTVDVLGALVDKSLVQARDRRLAQLEVVRQFAAGALAHTPEQKAVRKRHAEHYLRLAERLGPEVRTKGRGSAFDAMERDLGNLRAALDHWIGEGDGVRALRLAAAVEPYWTMSCRYREGLQAVDAALALERQAGERIRGRARLARSMLVRQVSMEEGIEDADAALALSSAAGDIAGRCMALDMIAGYAAYFGDPERAAAVAREERALAERLGDPNQLAAAVLRQGWCAATLDEARVFVDEAIPLLRRCGNVRGIVEAAMGVISTALDVEDYDTAAMAAEEALRAAQEAGEPSMLAFALGNAALSALFRMQIDVAEPLFREQMKVRRRAHIELLWDEPTLGLACIAAHAGEHDRAATLMGSYEAMPSLAVAPADQQIYDRLMARFITPARTALGERAWEHAAAVGATMSPDELCDFALRRRTDDAEAVAPGGRAGRRAAT